MDQHRQIRPDADDYLGDVEELAATIAHGHVVHIAFAAAMSRWGLLFIPRTAIVSFGQDMRGVGPYEYEAHPNPHWLRPKRTMNGYTTLAIVEGHQQGVHTFAVGTWHAPDYVGGKLWGAKYNAVDALVLSGLLNRIERCRLRLAGDPLSMAQLERWEWQAYETIERRDGCVPQADRFSELTGCNPGLARDLETGKARRV
jgi:hypothetical protein